MRILSFTPAFFLFTVLMNPVFLPEQAYAESRCCASGECYLFCTCPGESLECPWYPKPPEPQVTGAMSDINSVHDTRPVGAKNTDTSDGLIDVRRNSKCFLDRIALSLLGNARNVLKFEPILFDEKALHDQTVAFQMEADKEN